MAFWDSVSEALGFKEKKVPDINVDTTGTLNAAKDLQNTNTNVDQVAAGTRQAPTMANTSVANTGQQIAAQNMVRPQDVNAPKAAMAITPQVGQTQVAPMIGQNLAGTQGQNTALGLSTQAATGQAPSAAELQQNQAFQQAIASQMAQAAGSQGPGALRTAMQNTSGLQAQAAQQGGILRAQEMAQARGEVANVAGTMSAQDIARQQANQDTFMKGSLQDVQARVTALSADQQAQVTNAAQTLQAQGMNQDVAYRTAALNVTNALQAATSNAQIAMQRDVTQANLTSAEGIAKMDAYLKQTGLNDAMVQSLRNEAMQGRLNGAQLIAEAEKMKMQGQTSTATLTQAAQENAAKRLAATIGAAGSMAGQAASSLGSTSVGA